MFGMRGADHHFNTLEANSHITCGAHAVPMPCQCRAYAAPMPSPCHVRAVPMPCPCRAGAAPVPCSDHNVLKANF